MADAQGAAHARAGAGGWADPSAGAALQAPLFVGTTADPGAPTSPSWQWQQQAPPPVLPGADASALPPGPATAAAADLVSPGAAGLAAPPPIPLSEEEERKHRELLEYLEREYEKGERAYERELQRRSRKQQPQQGGSGGGGGGAASGGGGGGEGGSAPAALRVAFERQEEVDGADDAVPAPPQKKRKGSSRFRGVVRKEVPGKEVRVRWRAEMTLHGKSTWLGYYETEEQAARVFDVATLFHKARGDPHPPRTPRSTRPCCRRAGFFLT